MFSAYTIFNSKNQIYRSPFPPISIAEFKNRINRDDSPEEGSIEIDGYLYTYLKRTCKNNFKDNNVKNNLKDNTLNNNFNDDDFNDNDNLMTTTYTLITKNICINIAKHLFFNLTNYLVTIELFKFEDIIYAIDDCLNRHCYFIESCINLETNNLMESYEEKIYEMEMRNKELMAIKEMKMRSMKEEGYISGSYNDYENYGSYNEYKDDKYKEDTFNVMKGENKDGKYNEDKFVDLKPKKSTADEFPITNDDTQIFIYEKIKLNLIDNKLEDYSLTGEMNMFLRKEIDKIKFSHKGIIKFSPNLSKEYLRKGYLKGNKGFPVNKIIKVAKWCSQKGIKRDWRSKSKKDENNEDKNIHKDDYYECPLSFTFWDDLVEIEFFEDVYELKIEMEDGLLDVGDFKKGIFNQEIESPYPMTLRFRVEPVVKIEIEGFVQRKCEYEIFVDE